MDEIELRTGSSLIEEIARLTGLPSHYVFTEMSKQLIEIGCDPNRATMADVRRAMVAFLAQTMGEMSGLEMEESDLP